MEKHTFKTAEFAALCGVKKDTLLHYDHIDLLKPQRVGENGYRYYSARQLPTYDLIAALQRLGTPLAEIRDYLNRRSPEALLSLLEEKEAALEAERRRLEQMGRLLEDTVDKVRQARSVRPGDFFLEDSRRSSAPWCLRRRSTMRRLMRRSTFSTSASSWPGPGPTAFPPRPPATLSAGRHWSGGR